MTTLSDQIAALEARAYSSEEECDALKAQVQRQRGAIEEGRAERDQLRKAISRLQAKNNSYEHYFRSLHHGLHDLKAQNGNAGEIPPELSPIRSAGGSQSSRPAPSTVTSLADRIAKVRTA